MKVIVQRCKYGSIEINNKLYTKIDNGLVLLVGFTQEDTKKDIDYCVNKIINLRIFDDEKKIMNKNILDCKGEILSISQFTLYGDIKKGNRPSYIKALTASEAIKLYNQFNDKLNHYVSTKIGVFGEDMKVNILNDGPVTIIIDSKV